MNHVMIAAPFLRFPPPAWRQHNDEVASRTALEWDTSSARNLERIADWGEGQTGAWPNYVLWTEHQVVNLIPVLPELRPDPL